MNMETLVNAAEMKFYSELGCSPLDRSIDVVDAQSVISGIINIPEAKDTTSMKVVEEHQEEDALVSEPVANCRKESNIFNQVYSMHCVSSSSNTSNDGVELQIEQIIGYLARVAFKEEYFTEQLRAALTDILKLSALEIKHHQIYKDVSIDLLYKLTLRKYGKSIGKSAVTDELRLIHEAGFAMLNYQLFPVPLLNYDEFLVKYPEFMQTDSVEKGHLLHFRNMMAICQAVINPQNHKNHLIDLVTRLAEGKGIKYIVGSGQSDKTSRRVLIYRREGNVPLVSKGTYDAFHPGTDSIPTTFAASMLLTTSPTDNQFVHKLDKKREKHRMYLESMTQKRQDVFDRYRAQAIANNIATSVPIQAMQFVIRRGDKLETVLVENIVAYEVVKAAGSGEETSHSFTDLEDNSSSNSSSSSSNGSCDSESDSNHDSISMNSSSSDSFRSIIARQIPLPLPILQAL